MKEIGIRIAEANGLAGDFTWRIIVVKNDNENATGVALPDGKVISHLCHTHVSALSEGCGSNAPISNASCAVAIEISFLSVQT